MSTNIFITSDDVEKSKVIGEIVTNALVLTGFKEVVETFSAPERTPPTEPGGGSLLDEIKQTYPNFLSEPINVHAVKVEGLDVNGYDEEDEEEAFESRLSGSRDKFGDQFHTTVHLFEDRPKKLKPAEQREQDAQKRRSMMTNILAGKAIGTAVEDM